MLSNWCGVQIEGSVVHIMKALASHPLAAQCMAEDGTLELLFHIVSNGSLNVFSQLRQGLVPLHTVQLYRHAMQVTFSLELSLCFSPSCVGSPLKIIYTDFGAEVHGEKGRSDAHRTHIWVRWAMLPSDLLQDACTLDLHKYWSWHAQILKWHAHILKRIRWKCCLSNPNWVRWNWTYSASEVHEGFLEITIKT